VFVSGIFKNNKPTSVRDTKTGKIYQSRAEAGRSLAVEFGLDSTDRLVWYAILAKTQFGRFVDAETGKIITRSGQKL